MDKSSNIARNGIMTFQRNSPSSLFCVINNEILGLRKREASSQIKELPRQTHIIKKFHFKFTIVAAKIIEQKWILLLIDLSLLMMLAAN